MNDHHGFLIASPEYNSSFSAVLKNSIDWASRKVDENEPDLQCFKGKVAAIMSASPGGLGGLRGLVHLRALLENIHVMVLPSQVTVPAAYEAYHTDGTLIDQSKQKATEALGAALHAILKKLQG
jgi:NAD(P)H-dependent FMN reductase